MLNIGEPPTLPESLVVPQSSSSNQAVEYVLRQMREGLRIAQCNLAQAQERIKRQVDKARRVEEWKEGDQELHQYSEFTNTCDAYSDDIEKMLGESMNYLQSDIASCLQVGFVSGVADASSISC